MKPKINKLDYFFVPKGTTVTIVDKDGCESDVIFKEDGLVQAVEEIFVEERNYEEE